jgi:hypothetical protein
VCAKDQRGLGQGLRAHHRNNVRRSRGGRRMRRRRRRQRGKRRRGLNQPGSKRMGQQISDFFQFKFKNIHTFLTPSLGLSDLSRRRFAPPRSPRGGSLFFSCRHVSSATTTMQPPRSGSIFRQGNSKGKITYLPALGKDVVKASIESTAHRGGSGLQRYPVVLLGTGQFNAHRWADC